MPIDHHVFFSWCEKKTTKPNILPTRSQRSTITAAKMRPTSSLQVPIRDSHMCPDFVLDPSKDLASQIQPTR